MQRTCQPAAVLLGLILGALMCTASPAEAIHSVSTDSTYLLVDGRRHFLIGTYDPPPGISYDKIHSSGFDFLYESIGFILIQPWHEDLWRALGITLVDLPPGATADYVNTHESCPRLLVWHGPDEPAWQSESLTPEELRRGHEIVDEHDDYLGAPRPVWINHACRGTEAHPDSFELLRPYFDCADIFSMDIYPVPESYDHSILPNKSISCVGEHVDILRDLVSDHQGRQLKPIWMVLQGFSWTDFFYSREWFGTQQSYYDFSRVTHAATGDVNGDTFDDIVLLYGGEKNGDAGQRADVSLSTGERLRRPASWFDAPVESLPWDEVRSMGCGDVTGDHLEDLVLAAASRTGGGILAVLRSRGETSAGPEIWAASGNPILQPAHVVGYGVEDVDGDGIADVIVAANVDTSNTAGQSIWVGRSAGDDFEPFEEWLEAPSETVSFDNILEFRVGDFNGDGLGDVCFFHERDRRRLALTVATSQGSTFSPMSCWWDTTSVDLLTENIHGLTVQDLNGDGNTDLLLLYSQEDHLLTPQWLIAVLSGGTHFYTERWAVSSAASYPFERDYFALGGDFNGDGLGDFAALHGHVVPPDDPYHVIRVALSYGEKFGVPGPSFLESRFMAYDAIIHGATGILWWGLWYTGGPYSVWDGVSRVAQELEVMRTILTWDNATDTVACSAPAVEWCLKRGEGCHCLLAANRANTTLGVKISAPWVADCPSFDVMFEDRRLFAEDDTLADVFGPYEVHVYLGHDPGDPPPQPLPGQIKVFPNPFESTAQFILRSDERGPLSVDIYDVRGRLVRHLIGPVAEGPLHFLRWDGANSLGDEVPPGVYYCTVVMGSRALRQKVLCIR